MQAVLGTQPDRRLGAHGAAISAVRAVNLEHWGTLAVIDPEGCHKLEVLAAV